MLWCLHVRASDDVHPAPDYETALKWADYMFETFDRTAILSGDEDMVLLRAVPAPWPWSAESHAADLEKSIADWTPRSQKSTYPPEDMPHG